MPAHIVSEPLVVQNEVPDSVRELLSLPLALHPKGFFLLLFGGGCVCGTVAYAAAPS